MKTFMVYPTDEQEKIIQAFLEKNEISFLEEEETLPDYVLEGIARGQEDIKAGRFITHEEFKKRMRSAK
jgi:predicted transcriptional regulator